MDTKKIGMFLKELRRASGAEYAKIAEENITVTLKGLEKNYQTFKKVMMCILVVTTVLTMIILRLLPMNTVKDAIVMVLVIAVAFIANTLNLTLNVIALEAKEGISDNN